MKTIIGDKIFVKNPTNKIRYWANENLTVANPTYVTLARLGKEDTIRRKHVPSEIKLYIEGTDFIILPSGCLKGVWNLLKDDEYSLSFAEEHKIPDSHFETTNPVKFEGDYVYQKEAVDYMAKSKGGVLQASCGGGKTEMSIGIFEQLRLRTLFLVPTGDLLTQAKERYLKYYPKLSVGEITEGKVKLADDIVFSTWQTMCKIDRSIYADYFNVVICDECHRVCSAPTQVKQLGQIVDTCKARYKFGLSATPSRNDSLTPSMYALLGLNNNGGFKPTYTINRKDTHTLTAKHEAIMLDTPLDYSILADDGSLDFNNLIEYLTTNKERNQIILNKIIECDKEGRKQLVLCNRIEQCDILYKALLQLGYKVGLLVGSVSKKNRNSILKCEQDWNIIIATYSLAKEGLDLPVLDTLHLATIQKAKNIVVQSVGRIERVSENKKEPIVYDYVDKEIPYCMGAYKKRRRDLKNRYDNN